MYPLMRMMILAGLVLPTVNTSRADTPIATREKLFSIPFSVDSKEIFEANGTQPHEVQLLVSHDRGAHWSLYQRQSPTGRRFSFRAEQDGEYWFKVRTIGRNGRVIRPSEEQVELKVVIDSVQPELDFVVRERQTGVDLTWNISDTLIDLATFRVKYSTDNGSTWNDLHIESLSSQTTSRNQVAGSYHWLPDTKRSNLLLRAEVQDRAGNLAVADRKLSLSTVARNQSLFKDDPESASPGTVATKPVETRGRIVPWPSEPTRALPLPQAVESDWWYSNRGLPSRRRGDAEPIAPGAPLAEDERGRDPRWVTVPISRSKIDEHHNRYSPISHSKNGGVEDNEDVSSQVLLCNSKRFEIKYDVDSAEEYSRVELWYTLDEGKSWRHFGDDKDRRSPYRVSVDREGRYGFRFVFHRSNGIPARTPKTGDEPDVWVAVDWTKPVARLRSVHYGRGANAGRLLIQWEANDRQLASHPISLYYSVHPNGPWSLIEDGLANSGEYSWIAGPNVPEQFYLRMITRDQVGNKNSSQLDYPIRADGLMARARNLSIRPVPPEADSSGTESAYSRD